MIDQKSYDHIPVLIPAYQPDDRLAAICGDVSAAGFDVLVVDDGSGEDYSQYFDAAAAIDGVTVITYETATNMGKGYALKFGFRYLLETDPALTGVVTADSDGQHSTTDIGRVADELAEHRDSLVLGSRDFDGPDVPKKNAFGNRLSRWLFAVFGRVRVTDTQTGLRGIPKALMETMLSVRSNRFEFESEMLLKTRGLCPIREVTIETIYDDPEHYSTHYHPIRDSLRIGRVLAGSFGRFLLTSLSSAVIDLILFHVFVLIFRPNFAAYAAIATACARIISGTYNYLVNYVFVFQSEKKKAVSAGKYLTLALCQMAASALAISGLLALFPTGNDVILKMIVDSLLFLISYQIQKRFIF